MYTRDLIKSVLVKSHLHELYNSLGKRVKNIFLADSVVITEEDTLIDETLDIQYIQEHVCSVINPIPFARDTQYWGFFHMKLLEDGYYVSLDPADQFYGKDEVADLFTEFGFHKYTDDVAFETQEEVIQYAKKIRKDFDKLVKNYPDIFRW